MALAKPPAQDAPVAPARTRTHASTEPAKDVDGADTSKQTSAAPAVDIATLFAIPPMPVAPPPPSTTSFDASVAFAPTPTPSPAPATTPTLDPTAIVDASPQPIATNTTPQAKSQTRARASAPSSDESDAKTAALTTLQLPPTKSFEHAPAQHDPKVTSLATRATAQTKPATTDGDARPEPTKRATSERADVTRPAAPAEIASAAPAAQASAPSAPAAVTPASTVAAAPTTTTTTNDAAAATVTTTAPADNSLTPSDASARQRAVSSAINQMTVRHGASGRVDLAELGAVHVEARQVAGSIAVDVRVEHANVAQTLQHAHDALMTTARQGDLPVWKLDVEHDASRFATQRDAREQQKRQEREETDDEDLTPKPGKPTARFVL